MINGGKFSLKSFSASFFTLMFSVLTLIAMGNYSETNVFNESTAKLTDTVPVVNARDTTPKVRGLDSTKKDTSKLVTKVDTFGVKVSKDTLDAPISYTASDSMVLDAPTKKIYLYNKAHVKYSDITLDAYQIALDQNTQIITATHTFDTLNQMVQKPKFAQADSKTESDSLAFDMKTMKGLTRNTYVNQGEIFLNSEKAKAVSKQIYYAYRGRFTTCDLDTPHFAFRANKMELINKKYAITGPVHPEFEGVPLPLYIPFGFFPLSQGRHSGLLPPQFVSNEQYGLGLEGLGYYKVLNEHFDVLLRTNIYSYGGWMATVTPTYRKRYRYSGQMSFSYNHMRMLSNAGAQEFTTSKLWSLMWSHTVDSKARPGTTFMASVNISSSKYNQYSYNPTVNFNNQLYSSIAYTKNWNNKYNLSLSAGHDQNNVTRLYNIRLPNGAFTVNNFYPFQPKEFVGTPKWYQKLGIGLNTTFTNQTSFYDTAFSMSKLLDTMQWGVSHNIPISLSLPPILGGAVTVAPGVSLQEKWYGERIYREWDPTNNLLRVSHNKGFYMANDVSFSLSLSTALFGTYNKFGKNSKLQAIRHVIRPTVGISYKPDLAAKDYYSTIVNVIDNQQKGTRDTIYQRYSYYTGTINGPFSEGTFGGINFGLDNNLEMKVRSKKDSTNGGIKKVKLIDGFGVNGSYNLMADSFKLSTMNFYLRSTLFEKVNLTANAVLDPYQTNDRGYRIDKYAWQGGGKFSLGQITNGSIALSTQFSSKKKEQKEKALKNNTDNSLPMTMEEQQSQIDYIRNNPAEFADFDIPWNVNVSYSLSFSRALKYDYSGYETRVTSSITLGGDFNLTPKWKVGANTYYDFKGGSIQQLTMFISREMHCWQMAINVTPVGITRYFNITINPKSSILRDLRVNKRNSFYGGT
ncbi:LPS-assembly protein LptD [Parasegetibacter sp. MAH-26]|uniref:LPS-assembly protein LptD n=2 Tax=Pinibacter aurantiacus TaxID=2851599 RepID=A0A9E2W2F7_9BACT|nr:LPS-assembly protein LptD [Pinibacter aurantiacus]